MNGENERAKMQKENEAHYKALLEKAITEAERRRLEELENKQLADSETPRKGYYQGRHRKRKN